MNNLVIQFNIDPNLYLNETKKTTLSKTNKFIFEYSQKSFKEYCNKFGVEHIVITQPKINYEHPTWERLDLWLDPYWVNTYDNICYVDTDVFAMPWAKNIFLESDKECFSRIPYWKADLMLQKYKLFYDCDHDRVRECWFQTGVILLNKNVILKTKKIMERYKESIFTDDGVLLNYAIINSELKIKNIQKEFNVKFTETSKLEDIQFLHAFGRLKDSNPDLVLNTLRSIYDTK